MASAPPTASDLANMLSHLSPAQVPRQAAEQALKSHPDFSALWRHCERHGLSPLIYRNAKDLELLTHFPPDERRRFRRAYYRTLSNNLTYLDALREIAQNCSENTRVAVLKGPVLIDQIYKNPALRPLSDLDLLIHPASRKALRETLARLGYTPNAQYPEIYTRGATLLDLHADVLNASRIETRSKATPLSNDDLWNNARPIDGYEPFLQLSPEDQILTLAIHGLKHGFNRKIWLIDLIGCLLEIPDVSAWHPVRLRAETARAAHILALSLHAIQIHLNHPLPTFAQDLQKSFPIGPICLKILRIGETSGPFQVLEPLVTLKNLPNMRAKLAYLWEIVFPKREVMAQISGVSGRATFWLSYPYRVAQLATLGLAQLAKLIIRSLHNT